MAELFPAFEPRRGLKPKVKYRVRTLQFGDGYSQRTHDGINSREDAYPLTFTLPHADIETIKQFIDVRAGVVPFLWVPPGEAQGAFVCNGFTGPIKMGPTHSELTCTFNRVFDL